MPKAISIKSSQLWSTGVLSHFLGVLSYRFISRFCTWLHHTKSLWPLPIEAALNLYRRKLLKLGPQFWDHFLYYNHSAHLTVICEDLPEYTNYIAPDFVNLDSDGMYFKSYLFTV